MLTETEIRRDQYGRPLLKPAGGGRPVPHTRVSTLAKTLDDTFGLSQWQQRMVARGMAARPDLVLAAASAKPDDTRTLNEVCSTAMEVAGAGSAAGIGTALHSLTEVVDNGDPLPRLDAATIASLDAYRRAMEPCHVIAMEQFVVCDPLTAAGTFDRLVFHEGRLRVLDLKTGAQAHRYAHATSIQEAVYAHSKVYDDETGERRPIETLAGGQAGDIDLEVALMLWLPVGKGEATLIKVDIATGWKMATVAYGVRAWRKRPATL